MLCWLRPHRVQVRTLLDKYDEEEDEVVMQLGAFGRLEAERLRRQEEVRQKLAEGEGGTQQLANRVGFG